MSTTDLATTGDNLPDLVDPRKSEDIDARDIALLRLYRGEKSAAAVDNDLVPKGCIYLATDGDDDDPEVLIDKAVDIDTAKEGVLIHVLHAWKGWNYTDPQTKEFFSYRWDDPNRHPESRKAYHYMVVLPEWDDAVPVKLTLAKSSKRVGDRVNYQLLKHEGADHEVAFRLSLKERTKTDNGQTNRWYVWVAKSVDADKKHVKAAAELVDFAKAAAAAPPQAASTAPANDGPAI